MNKPKPDQSATPQPRGDLQFGWAASDASLNIWREALHTWAKETHGKDAACRGGNALLDYLIANPTVARHPEQFCRRAYANPCPWPPRAGSAPPIKTVNGVHAFFEWYLNHHLAALDDYGRPKPSPEHWNPITRANRASNATETARQALPTRLIRELLRLLMDDDWAWAKSQNADWIEIPNPTTGIPERVWCPVRASALALKLLLPLRTFQVRLLESGEGDTDCYSEGRWVPNQSSHAPPEGCTVRRGFLRAFRDRATGTVSTGFFVNTNKTSDRLPDAGETGYEIPWQHERAITVVADLLRWQIAHNPMAEPMLWSVLHERLVQLGAPRPGRAFFLFRDPNGQHHNEPVSDGRLQTFWAQLVAALERRLADRGDRAADGSPIRLIESTARWPGMRSLYDLHSLRVSLLTALATDGGVPLHVLSRCIAGHASIIMTLYYVKTDALKMTQCLTEATAKIDGASQENFARYLSSQVRASDSVVSNDPAGMMALDSGGPASWTMLQTGICPVGGTRCSVGGPLLAKNVYGPVPGGARNCVRCRFHITGPAFLSGLVDRFNATSFRWESAKRELRAAQQALEEVENRQFDREMEGNAGDPGALIRSQERRERAEAVEDTVLATLHAINVLVERCKAVPQPKDESGLNLVLVGGVNELTTSIRETSEIDVADAVCKAATVHPCDEVSEASLRRSRAIDRMLVGHGQVPVMMSLSEDEALRAGNEFMRLMSRQVGRGRTLQLLNGTPQVLEADVADIVNSLTVSLRTGNRDQLRLVHEPQPPDALIEEAP